MITYPQGKLIGTDPDVIELSSDDLFSVDLAFDGVLGKFDLPFESEFYDLGFKLDESYELSILNN